MKTNSVELLESAVKHAKSLGVAVRAEFMEGLPGGLCRIGNQLYLFLDQSLTAADQLDVVMQALHDPQIRKASDKR
jgi:hypothetical protein